jgi:hypothetical protein
MDLLGNGIKDQQVRNRVGVTSSELKNVARTLKDMYGV